MLFRSGLVIVAAVGVIGLKLLLEIPVDLVGRTVPLPAEAGYATAPDYAEKLTRVINTTLRLQRSLA